MFSKKSLALATLVSIIATSANAETFIIVHGAFQNAASWSTVADDLRAKGNTVIAVDLPGRDAEGDAAKAITLKQYIDTVGKVVGEQAGPVVLVAHSFGGITISGVAEAMPEKVKKLVYVAAYVPASGESMEKLAQGDKDNGFTEKSFVLAPDYSYASILEEDRARLFANDGSPDQQKAVSASMIREPLGPIATPIEVSAEKFGAVAKAYVRTTMDATVSPAIQKMMIERASIKNVADIETGHSPQSTQPVKLAETIIAVSK